MHCRSDWTVNGMRMPHCVQDKYIFHFLQNGRAEEIRIVDNVKCSWHAERKREEKMPHKVDIRVVINFIVRSCLIQNLCKKKAREHQNCEKSFLFDNVLSSSPSSLLLLCRMEDEDIIRIWIKTLVSQSQCKYAKPTNGKKTAKNSHRNSLPLLCARNGMTWFTWSVVIDYLHRFHLLCLPFAEANGGSRQRQSRLPETGYTSMYFSFAPAVSHLQPHFYRISFAKNWHTARTQRQEKVKVFRILFFFFVRLLSFACLSHFLESASVGRAFSRVAYTSDERIAIMTVEQWNKCASTPNISAKILRIYLWCERVIRAPPCRTIVLRAIFFSFAVSSFRVSFRIIKCRGNCGTLVLLAVSQCHCDA